MCQMLRRTLLGDLALSLKVRLGFNRSRISEKIHYSESFSAEKIKQNQKTANKPAPKSQAIFSFLAFSSSLFITHEPHNSKMFKEFRNQNLPFPPSTATRSCSGSSQKEGPRGVFSCNSPQARWEFQRRQICQECGTQHRTGPFHHS